MHPPAFSFPNPEDDEYTQSSTRMLQHTGLRRLEVYDGCAPLLFARLWLPQLRHLHLESSTSFPSSSSSSINGPLSCEIDARQFPKLITLSLSNVRGMIICFWYYFNANALPSISLVPSEQYQRLSDCCTAIVLCYVGACLIGTGRRKQQLFVFVA